MREVGCGSEIQFEFELQDNGEARLTRTPTSVNFMAKLPENSFVTARYEFETFIYQAFNHMLRFTFFFNLKTQQILWTLIVFVHVLFRIIEVQNAWASITGDAEALSGDDCARVENKYEENDVLMVNI